MKKYFENLRKYAFWLKDFVLGQPVRKHYENINDHFNSELAENSVKMTQLLFHAVKTTKFYANIGNFESLTKIPVVNKSIIRESFNDFLSDKFDKNELIPVVTSGSTGTPFQIFHNRDKKNRNYADTLYFARLAGYEVGHRLLYLKIWARQKMKPPLSYWLQNITPIDVIRLDQKQIAQIIAKLEEDTSTYGIIGYASALEQFSLFLEAHYRRKINANVKSIIAISESLNDFTKEGLKKYLGVPVVSRYSNLENGIIAQQENGNSSRFIVNTASYHVEILKLDKDEPAPPGQLGRIVVTDLFNYAVPMIRYDTGDLGAFEEDPAYPGRTYLSRIEGRKLDMLYDTKGEMVSSYIMYKNMWQYTEIKQYQLIQEGIKDYRFKINADGGFTRESRLIDEFKQYLGQDANFIVEYVDEIPLLSSGKRRKVVNKYYS